jgi:hypothetical protein
MGARPAPLHNRPSPSQRYLSRSTSAYTSLTDAEQSSTTTDTICGTASTSFISPHRAVSRATARTCARWPPQIVKATSRHADLYVARHLARDCWECRSSERRQDGVRAPGAPDMRNWMRAERHGYGAELHRASLNGRRKPAVTHSAPRDSRSASQCASQVLNRSTKTLPRTSAMVDSSQSLPEQGWRPRARTNVLVTTPDLTATLGLPPQPLRDSEDRVSMTCRALPGARE